LYTYHVLTSVQPLSAHTHFFENHCVAPAAVPYHCGAGPAPFYNKSYHVDVHPNATEEPSWEGACACYPDPAKTDAPPCPYKTLGDWQAAGHGAGTTLQLGISNAAILREAREKLGMAAVTNL
jgi:hypothetical protein